MGAKYLSTKKQWDALVKICRKKGVFGLDTEFYNVDPSKQSCYGRARVHVWSIAVRTDQLDVRGYTKCIGWMLPAAALDYAPIRALLEDKAVKKEVHNESVDKHSLKNHGIVLRGARDTLNYVKWQRPELINLPGRFKLKNLMWVLLRKRPVCTFKELVSDERMIQVENTRDKKVKGCSCGARKCAKRKPTVVQTAKGVKVIPHTKTERLLSVTTYRTKKEKFKHPLESIVPGHVRWPLLEKYAIEDAVCALQVAEIAGDAEDPAPFVYVKDLVRPAFSQPVVEAIIAMEQVGFPRDKDFCTKQAEVAVADEERILDWLFRWYVANSGVVGPHGRILKTKKTRAGKVSITSGTDGIWSSVAKLLKLFDKRKFPRSPVWGKGKVKQGKAKLDQKALEWISDNCPPAKPLIAKILELKNIRSGKKYLTQLRDAEDIVYPICGGAGDEDERSGAVTGRLGIKGTLAAQQLPKPGEKDKYNVRRAIIA